MTPPTREKLPPGLWKIASVATLGSFMAQLDSAIVNVSLAGLATALHSTLPVVQWVTSGYLLALALMLPLNGWLVGRIGAKAVYLWCFAAFGLTSALCGMAWSAGSLIAFRILQGMSGGLMAPMAQMMIARAAGRQMPRVASIMAMPILLAPLLGPVVAGAILHFASWRWLFLINLPVGLLAFVLAVLFLPATRDDRQPRSFDLAGFVLLSPALALFLYGTDHVRNGVGLASLLGALVLLGLFVRHGRRQGDAALVDLRLLRRRGFAVPVAVMFMVNGVTFAGQMLIPFYLVHATGTSAVRTGGLMAPLGLGMMCGYPLVGRLTERLGVRRLSSAGAALAGAATLPLVWLAGHGLRVDVLAASLFLRGLAMGGVGMPANSAGYASVPRRELAMAATVMNIGQRLGGPAWTTICATFLAWQLGTHATPHAFAAAFGLLCAAHGVLFAVTLGLPRRQPDPAP